MAIQQILHVALQDICLCQNIWILTLGSCHIDIAPLQFPHFRISLVATRVSLSRFRDGKFPGKFKTFQSFTHSFFLSAFINTHYKTICIAVCKFPVSGLGFREIFELSKLNRQESCVFLT